MLQMRRVCRWILIAFFWALFEFLVVDGEREFFLMAFSDVAASTFGTNFSFVDIGAAANCLEVRIAS